MMLLEGLILLILTSWGFNDCHIYLLSFPNFLGGLASFIAVTGILLILLI